MFRIRHDIIFSAMVHSILLAAALLIGGSSEIRKSSLLMVSLFDEKDNRADNKLPARSEKKPDTQAHATPKPVAKTVTELLATQEIMPSQSLPAMAPPNPLPALNRDYSHGVPGFQAQNNFSPIGGDSRSSVISQTARSGSGDISAGSMTRGQAEQTNQMATSPSLKQIIRGTLQNNLVYPYMARKRRMEGTVLVDFRINQKGIAENVRVLKGSGFPLLDSAAMETVVKSSPFPLANYSIEVPITYQLTQN
jgi:protein TonB